MIHTAPGESTNPPLRPSEHDTKFSSTVRAIGEQPHLVSVIALFISPYRIWPFTIRAALRAAGPGGSPGHAALGRQSLAADNSWLTAAPAKPIRRL